MNGELDLRPSVRTNSIFIGIFLDLWCFLAQLAGDDDKVSMSTPSKSCLQARPQFVVLIARKLGGVCQEGSETGRCRNGVCQNESNGRVKVIPFDSPAAAPPKRWQLKKNT